MRSYQYAKDDELTREDLIADQDFIIDAGDYLAKRGVLDSEDPTEIYETYMEQMRFHEVNELDTISDLMYAQEADDEDREQMARMFETFDRMDLDLTDELAGKVGDYGWGIVTAPSTYLGFATGGSSKVAAFAGQRAAQAGLRRILAGMATGAAVEGGIGAGQNVAQQATRMELDPDREFSGKELALVTGLSAVPGALLGGVGQVKRNRLIEKADALKAQADAAMEGAEELARQNVKKATSENGKAVNQVKEDLTQSGFDADTVVEVGTLRPINPDLVEAGETILEAQARLIDEGYAVRVGDELFERISVVATELAKKGGIKRKSGQRITESVSEALLNKEIPAEILDDILDTYNISHRDLGPIYAATASKAGSQLQAVGQISKSWKEYTDSLSRQKFDSPGAQPADPDSAIEKFLKSPIRTLNKIERVRRSILTSQPVTTIRNFFGGGARVTLDMFEQFWASGTRKAANTARKAMGLDPVEDISGIGAGDIARYVWNDEEAKMIADLYMRLDNKGYERMFSNFIDAAEASNNSATGNGFDRVGSFFNVFNRMSDNFWKKAVFAGEISRLTRARYGKTLTDIISDRQFNKIDDDIFEKAVEKSFELVYQQTPKGNGIFSGFARTYLDWDKKGGFALGALIPFPRFVINQIKFMYEHAPILGMIPVDALTAKGGLKDFNWSKRMGQQINGLGMLGMAYALRDAMGPETEWYNYVKEDGTKLDLRPFLGPLNMHLYLADLIYRSGMFDGDPKPVKPASGLTAEILQTAVGSSFRAGTGLFVVDRALPELIGALDGEETSIKGDQVWGQILGDYANTYTYQWPIAVARDLYSLTDEDLRLIPETKIGLDYLEITALRARRSLGPLADWAPTVSEEFLKKDIPYIPDVTFKHMFPFYNVDKPQERYDIFDPRPLRKIDPIRTAVSGLNISPSANTFVKERIRLQLMPYDIYRAHPFPPADRYIRQELSQRLPMQMERVIKSPEYQKLSDAEKKVVFIREAKYLMNEIRNKTRIDEAIAKEMKRGRIPDATERDHLKWRFESLPKMYRDAVEARLGAPTKDSDYVDYLKEYDVIKESWFGTVKKAQGGLVQKLAVGGMPTPIDEQMDALSLSEAETAGEEPQSLSGVMAKIAEVGGDVWDNMNYLDRAALVTAPVPVVGDVTGLIADAYMYATKPEERTALNYSLTGAGLAGGLPASVTSAIGSSPALLGIFGAARIHKPEAYDRYKKLMTEPLTKEQEKLIAEDPEALAKIMEEKAQRVFKETGVTVMEGTDLKPRFEIDDSKAQLKNIEIKEMAGGKERFLQYTIAGNKLGAARAGSLGKESYGTVGDILEHEELYDIYPEAKNIPLAPIGDGSYRGFFQAPAYGSKSPGAIALSGDIAEDADFPKADLKSTLLHELQHYVQFVDELNSGGSATDLFLPNGFKELKDFLDIPKNNILSTINQNTSVSKSGTSLLGKVPKVLISGHPKDIKKYFSELSSVNKVTRDAAIERLNREFASDSKLAQELKEKILDITSVQHEVQKVEFDGYLNYRTVAGEAEARLVQDRRAYTPEMRQAEMPSIIKLLRKEEAQSTEDIYMGAGRAFTYPKQYEDTVVGVRTRTDRGFPRPPVFNAEYIERVTKVGEDSIKLLDSFKDSKALQESAKIKYKTAEEYDEFLDKFKSSFKKSIKERLKNKDFDVFIPPVSASDELWDAPTQKITSADTSMNVSKLPKGYTKLKNIGAFKPGQRVVDIGGGRFDNAVEDLAKQDVELLVYDPFNRTAEHNKAVVDIIANGGADVAVSNNTLNVIEEPENIKRVIQQAENAIKPGDKAYFTVYAGDGKGKGKTTSKGYQRNEPTSAYVPRVEEVFGEGNVVRNGNLITATKQ